jgi:drug/metabolite transporter (DMT)-like permease
MTLFNINKTLVPTGDSSKQLSLLNQFTSHKKNDRSLAIFALWIICFFWGTTWVASRQGVLHMPPLQLAGMRHFIGGLFFVIFFAVRKASWPDKRQWQKIFVLGMLNFFFGNGLITWGMKFISAGLGSIIGATFSLWLVVINLFLSRSKISLKAIMGFITGFSGICIIFYEHLHDFLNSGFRFGIILSFIGTASWAVGTLFMKKKAASFNPYFSLGLQMLISGAALLTITCITGNAIALTAIPWQSWLAISYLIVFGSIISFTAYLYSLRTLGPEQTSIFAYVNPVVAVLTGWLIFDEKLTVFIAVGGLITISSVYLINKAN